MIGASIVINEAITRLIDYAENTGLIENEDRIYAANRIIEVLGLDEFEETVYTGEKPLCDILAELVDFARNQGIIEDGIVASDLFDTKLMGLLTPRPSEVIAKFNKDYSVSPKTATDSFYKFSCDTNYIRRDRIAKDMKWACRYMSWEFSRFPFRVIFQNPKRTRKPSPPQRMQNSRVILNVCSAENVKAMQEELISLQGRITG